jgi:hypothetical protein
MSRLILAAPFVVIAVFYAGAFVGQALLRRSWQRGAPAGVAARIRFICHETRDTNIDGASPTRTFIMRPVYQPDHAKRLCSAGHLDVSIRGAHGPYRLRLGAEYFVDFTKSIPDPGSKGRA